ncbi:MAG: hypothetical protein KGI66_05280, partial [Patescibacteria group bacterium]|nr:hypothetical protein [Patescibacteria group bacterium]
IRMTISNTGNVGIGTTSPWTTLSVNGFSDLGYGAQAGYFNATNTNATSTLAGALQVGSATSPADAGMQFGLDPFAWTIGYKASDNSFRISSSTALGSNDIFTLAKGGNFTLNSTGATSTINGNLYVNGTLRGTDVYSGDLIFANGFRYTEAPLGTTTSQGLLLRNQNSQDVLSIDEKGNLSVAGDVCYAGKQCFGKSLNSLADYVSSLASSTAESLFSSQATTTASLADLTASVGSLQTELGAIHAQVDSLSSTTADSSILAAEAVSALTGSSTALDLIASSTASSTASMLASSTSFIQAVTGAVQAAIQSAGNWIVDKLTAHVVYTDRVEAKVAAISEGIEMT